MECKWTTLGVALLSFSNGDLTATSTQSGVWHSTFGTASAKADYPGGRMFDVTFSGIISNCMVGIARKSANAINTHQSTAYLYYSAGNVWASNSYSGSYPTWGSSDRITILLKNGKLYAAKNGTWINSGNPDAETGYIASGLTGEWVPCVLFYDANSATLHAGTSITTSLPTGVLRWDQLATVSVSLKTPAGADFASQSVKWSVFPASTPDLVSQVDAYGTGTTSSGGVLTITYRGTALEDGDACLVAISNTDGTVGAQCQSMFAPAEVSIAA